MIDNKLLDIVNPSTGEKVVSITTDTKQSALLKINQAHSFLINQ